MPRSLLAISAPTRHMRSVCSTASAKRVSMQQSDRSSTKLQTNGGGVCAHRAPLTDQFRTWVPCGASANDLHALRREDCHLHQTTGVRPGLPVHLRLVGKDRGDALVGAAAAIGGYHQRGQLGQHRTMVMDNQVNLGAFRGLETIAEPGV